MKKLYVLIAIATPLLFVSCAKEGCTDKIAKNYDKDAKKDDGTCKYVYGCTDPVSVNYDAEATLDDESCMSFVNWDKWVLEITKTGIDTNLAVAHAGNDSTSTRDVYFMDGKAPENGVYPEGTMIFKYSRSADGVTNEYVGMVKQEVGFNAESNDWEWFMLNEDGSIAKDADELDLRGGNLLGGSCIACHQYATTDMVFSK
jgi:hypothetical protein